MFGVGEAMCALDRIGWWWTRARKLSGIDKKWRLHDLRHWSRSVRATTSAPSRIVSATPTRP
jgi:hypothetical protein